MHNHIIITFTFLYALLSTAFAMADELETSQPILDKGSLYFYLGDHHADTTKNQLENPSSEFALGMGGVFDYSEYLGLGFDLLYASKSYDTPEYVSCGPLFGCSDDMIIGTFGLNLTARLTYTMGITSFYTGVGAGLYFTELTLTSVLPGSHEETSNDLGYFYNFGVMLNISKSRYLGLEYRKLSLEANLSPVTTGNVDIGGDFLLVTYVIRF